MTTIDDDEQKEDNPVVDNEPLPIDWNRIYEDLLKNHTSDREALLRILDLLQNSSSSAVSGDGAGNHELGEVLLPAINELELQTFLATILRTLYRHDLARMVIQYVEDGETKNKPTSGADPDDPNEPDENGVQFSSDESSVSTSSSVGESEISSDKSIDEGRGSSNT